MSDLLIVARSSPRHYVTRAALLLAMLLLVATIVAWFIFQREVSYDFPAGSVSAEAVVVEVDTTGSPRLVWGPQSLAYQGKLMILRAAGSPHDLGAAHGRLVGSAVKDVFAGFATTLADAVPNNSWWDRKTFTMRKAWRYRFVDDGMSERDRRWIAGIVRGAAASATSLDYEDMLRAQTALDVGAPSPGTDEKKWKRLAHTLTVASQPTTATGLGLWFGYRLGLSGLADAGQAVAEAPLLTIARPDDRIAWASIGWPGAAGVVAGINAARIMVLVHPVTAADVYPTRVARPITLLARDLLETSKSLDDAIRLIESSPTLGAAIYVLADGKTNTWSIVERSPRRIKVVKGPALLSLGDLFTTHLFADDVENDRARQVLPTASRSERANKLLKPPMAEIASLAAVLRDRKTPDDVPRPYGHRGVIDDGSLGPVALFDPSSLWLWIAPNGPQGDFIAFDLQFELVGDSDHATPPASIPGVPGDPELESTTQRARAMLRRARLALRRGDKTLGKELIDRARAMRPNLPEALVMAADWEKNRGKTAEAQTLYRNWLELGPDDPARVIDVNAFLASPASAPFSP